MTSQNAETGRHPRFFQTLKGDVRRGDFQQTIGRDFRELKEYMLDEERKRELAGMRPLKRGLLLLWWLLKSMFFKLTPARRIVLLIGLVLVVIERTVIYSDQGSSFSIQTNGIGVLAIVFVLMLELKDKLIAHDELKAGRAVQQALMPVANPQVDGWDIWLYSRPANDVGGDLVDFLKLDARRYGISIGDVAGKGLSAALLTAKLQATLRALAADSPSLTSLAATVNRIFCRDSLRSIFASLLYLEIAPANGTVKFVNAGHLPPVLVQNGRVQKLEKGKAALGIMPNAIFEERTLELGTEQVLLAYSDGLTEAQNARGEFFGEHRLAEILSGIQNVTSSRIGEQLLAAVDVFVGDVRMFDDISIVVLKRV